MTLHEFMLNMLRISWDYQFNYQQTRLKLDTCGSNFIKFNSNFYVQYLTSVLKHVWDKTYFNNHCGAIESHFGLFHISVLSSPE